MLKMQLIIYYICCFLTNRYIKINSLNEQISKLNLFNKSIYPRVINISPFSFIKKYPNYVGVIKYCGIWNTYEFYIKKDNYTDISNSKRISDTIQIIHYNKIKGKHREDGPACYCLNTINNCTSYERYYLNGKSLTKGEWTHAIRFDKLGEFLNGNK